ncbi:hypothetical protein ABPG74_017187 [Tetrahymena malaccensis]
MGKRKNKQQDEDRIVPRRRIKKNQEEETGNKNQFNAVKEEEELISEDESINSDQLEELIEYEEQAQGEEKSKKQKFLEKFNIEETNEVDEQNQGKRLAKIPNKINIIQNQSQIINAFDSHFDKDFKELLSTDLEEIIKQKVEKKSEKELVREKMKEIFNIGNDGDSEIINPYKKHEEQKKKEKEMFKDFKDPVKEALNNKVEIKEYGIKKQLREKKNFSVENVDEYYIDSLAQKYVKEGLNCSTENLDQSIKLSDLTNSQLIQFGIINNYHDLVFIDQEEKRNESFRKLYCSHIMNHMSKVPLQKDFVEELAEKEALQKLKNSKKADTAVVNNEEDDLNCKKNKGYTNCKILIITPFKGDATTIINELLSIYGESKLKKKSNKQRFIEEYENPDRMDEDDFRIGISITNKGLKLFTPFEHCDIIVTSLVGLRLATGEKGDKDRNFSFLSSVEILVIDRAHVLYNQNWLHMNELMSLFNQIPKHKHVTNNIHQIREYYFENLAKFYRQTIVYTEFNFPELNSIKNRFMNNYKGCFQIKPYYQQLPHPKVNQEFIKFDIHNIQNEMDERIEFFKKKIWDDWNKEEMDGSVIFVSSYFEYIKLKSMFVKQNAPVFGICEYTKKRDVQKRIAQFKNGTLPYLMQTERAYFFDVGSIRGMKNILFFSLPKNSYIYQEMLSYLHPQSLKHSKCRVVSLFNKYDAFALERIVGTENAKEFLADYNKATSFVL